MGSLRDLTFPGKQLSEAVRTILKGLKNYLCLISSLVNVCLEASTVVRTERQARLLCDRGTCGRFYFNVILLTRKTPKNSLPIYSYAQNNVLF